MAKIDINAIQRANILLTRRLMKAGYINQIYVMEYYGYPSCTYKGYICKAYRAELRFEQVSKNEFKQAAKLRMIDTNIINTVNKEILLSNANEYLYEGINCDEDILIEISVSKAFSEDDWKKYRKYPKAFRERTYDCMFDTITDKRIRKDMSYIYEEMPDEDKEIILSTNEILGNNRVREQKLPREIPIQYIITLKSVSPIELISDSCPIISNTLFTYVNLDNTYISSDDTSEFICNNPMLRVLDISGMEHPEIKYAESMFMNNKRLHTIKGFSNLKFGNKVCNKSLFNWDYRLKNLE